MDLRDALIDWDDPEDDGSNTAHVAEHGLTPEEVELRSFAKILAARRARLGAWAAATQLAAWGVQWIACYVLLVALGLDLTRSWMVGDRWRDVDCGQRAGVRTVLAIDRDARSMTFAGDVPHGWVAQLMRGNFDHLARGGIARRSERIHGTW